MKKCPFMLCVWCIKAGAGLYRKSICFGFWRFAYPRLLQLDVPAGNGTAKQSDHNDRPGDCTQYVYFDHGFAGGLYKSCIRKIGRI